MKEIRIVILFITMFSCNQVNERLQIEKCLDNGDKWDYELNLCTQNTDSNKPLKKQELISPSQNLVRKGLLIPENFENWNPCCLYIPKTGLSLYKDANGIEIAKLELAKKDNNIEFYESQINYNDGKVENFELENFQMVGYEIYALKFIESENSFLQLYNKMWIDFTEISKKGLIYQSWMQYAIHKENVLGWYGNKPGVSLRREPNAGSEQIKLLDGDLFEIELSDVIMGNWIKVKVKEYDKHPCFDPSIKSVKSFSGWINLISKNGTLNVWNYEKGC